MARPASRGRCCSTSRPAASTSAPRRRSTRSSSALTEEGTAILLVSSELEELLALVRPACSCCARAGSAAGSPAAADPEDVATAMAGSQLRSRHDRRPRPGPTLERPARPGSCVSAGRGGARAGRRDRAARPAPAHRHRHRHRDRRCARRASARCGAVVLPAISVGCSYGHGRELPGTLSLSPEELAAVVRSYADWASASGLRRLLYLNAHLGNAAASTWAPTTSDCTGPICGSASVAWWDLSRRPARAMFREGPGRARQSRGNRHDAAPGAGPRSTGPTADVDDDDRSAGLCSATPSRPCPGTA